MLTRSVRTCLSADKAEGRPRVLGLLPTGSLPESQGGTVAAADSFQVPAVCREANTVLPGAMQHWGQWVILVQP